MDQSFNFYLPTEIVFGKGVENQVGEYVKKYGGTKALIVMDGGGFIQSSGLLAKVTDSLDSAGVGHVELEGVQPNPNASLVLKGLEVVKAEGIDFVLGIGGGSTMDTSKAIAIGMVNDGDVMDFFTHKRRPTKIGPVGAITTIAASGSETSGSALIKNDLEGGDGNKGGYNNPALRTRFALMDPELTYTVPPFQTACGSADIFSHTFDTYLSDEECYLADTFCEGLLKTVLKYSVIALEDPTNYEARAEMLLSASFSHNDVTRIGRGRPGATTHFVEEALGNKYHRTHGAGIALVMPACTQMALDRGTNTEERLAQLAVNVFDVDPGLGTKREVAQEGIDRMKAWLAGMGLPQTIREYGKVDSVSDEDIEEILSDIMFDDDGIFFGYGHVTRDDVRDMLKSII
jgi:alcohol dehydrogenase YqhD (iron-dependent ADH family)